MESSSFRKKMAKKEGWEKNEGKIYKYIIRTQDF